MPHDQDVARTLSVLLAPNECSSIKAFGESEIAIDGAVQSAVIELNVQGKNRFKADLYGPFGTEVASINADSVSGTVLIGRRVYVFRHEQSLDSFPVMYGSRLRFGDLLTILTGRVTPNLVAQFRDRKPDSLIARKKKITAVWKTDSLEIRVVLRGQLLQIEKVILTYTAQGIANKITFGRFRKGLASEIALIENDTNYFSMKYSKVVCGN
jgi:hypothetical protein